MMSKQEFIDQYIAAACATWSMINYNDYCLTGRALDLKIPPLEDIESLAESVWKMYEESK